MYKIVLTGLLLMILTNSWAQNDPNAKGGRITGKVIDSITKAPIEYATISVFTPGSKKALNGTTSNNIGQFTIEGLDQGNFTLVVESVGYLPTTINNVSFNKKNLDLRSITLLKSQVMLQGVTVSSQTGLIENKIDKMVFNAEKDLTSQGGVATDILKKVPQVSVDVDGNVELAGSASIRFLINGKPSSAFGSNISDVLQSIPASQIKSIEVITNPGAKYDAQGLGGIINIILKTSKVKGINGNLSLTAGTRMENGSVNLNARKGNFGINAFVSGNERLTARTPSTSDRLSIDTTAKTNILFHQDGDYQFKRHGYETGLGFDWTYNKYNSLSGSINYNNFGNNGVGMINQLQRITSQTGGGILSEIISVNNTNNGFNFHNIDASLNYKKTFSKEDQELGISLNSSFGNNTGTAGNSQRLFPQDSVTSGTQSNNPGKEHETELAIDYTQPIKKDVNLGLGAKLNIRDINSASNVLALQPLTKNYLADTSLSNYLNYHQKVYALYSEISFPVARLLSAKLGGRYERTEISSFFSNAQQQARIPGYNTFVPSVFFLKKIGDNQTVKLSYSKRIERPDYRDLNPFINTSDPKNISAGNPYLQPEIGNRYELSYSRELEKIGSFMITAFYRTSNHDIQPYIVYYPSYKVGDSTYTNVAVSIRQNIGLEKNLGLSLFGNLIVNTKLNIRTNLFFFERHTINLLDPGHNSNSFNYRLNINSSYQFPKNLAAEFFGNFNSPRHEVQGNYPSFTSYSFAVRKQFWNKKGSLALTATNPFGEYVNQKTSVFGTNFTVNSLRQVPYRSIGINFTWKFGKLEFKKEKDENKGDSNPPADVGTGN